jgi:putative zinc finger/helix-turn-helix YgiT family protein
MKNLVTICPECSEGNLVIQPVTLVGERYGEEFSVTVQGLHCENCDYQTIANSQSSDFTKAISDAYRRKHELLTGDEIKELRNRLEMNQLAFAEYLGVGSSSVKRWESGQIQEKAMDELIRLKADSARARSNYESLESRLSENCLYSTVIFSGEDADLSTCAYQRYYMSGHVDMRLDLSELDPEDALSHDDELIAA